MSDKREFPFTVSLIALLVVAVAIAIGWRLINGDSSLLRDAAVQKDVITPNADGADDATLIAYEISRNATVSIYFEDDVNGRFYFRQEKQRGAGEYKVLFSGVVDGYHLPDDVVEGQILSRLLQNGAYTWTITATDTQNVTETATGRLTIVDADTELPDMRNFTVYPDAFTPNRDGIADRVRPQFYLAKEVVSLRVFLLLADGREVPISELERDIPANEPGRHYYDYEGGVDNGAAPPPDGTYPLIAIAEDAEGQKIRVEDSLTIQYGGVPRADIFSPPIGDTLELNATAVAICDTLHFTITVRNHGATPIRTTGPEPGVVYDSDWNYNTLGWHTESGAWRVAIGYENEITNYPYRWAVGNVEDLEKIGDHYYLMPGERAIVTGGIRLVNVFGDRNPQPLWAGLIHEDVEIAQFNTHVDPHAVQVDVPDAAHMPQCAARDVPLKE